MEKEQLLESLFAAAATLAREEWGLLIEFTKAVRDGDTEAQKRLWDEAQKRTEAIAQC